MTCATYALCIQHRPRISSRGFQQSRTSDTVWLTPGLNVHSAKSQYRERPFLVSIETCFCYALASTSANISTPKQSKLRYDLSNRRVVADRLVRYESCV